MIKSLWMLVASLLFALMAAFARMGASDFSALELVFYRSAFGAAVIALWVWAQGFTLRTPLCVRISHAQKSLGMILQNLLDLVLATPGSCLPCSTKAESLPQRIKSFQLLFSLNLLEWRFSTVQHWRHVAYGWYMPQYPCLLFWVLWSPLRKPSQIFCPGSATVSHRCPPDFGHHSSEADFLEP